MSQEAMMVMVLLLHHSRTETDKNHKQSLPVIGLNLNQYLIMWVSILVLFVPTHLALTFKRPGWYLYFHAWFMKNMRFEKKKIKLWNKLHFVENKTEIMQHVLKIQ
jgi:hypothetical protein